MKVEKTTIIPQNVLYLPACVQVSQDGDGATQQNHANYRTSESLSELNLLDQILIIQRIKNELGIEALAAADLNSLFPWSRTEKARWMGRAPHNPDDLRKLEERVGKELNANVMVAIIDAMVNIVQGVGSEKIPNIWYRDSNLMSTARDVPLKDRPFAPYTFSCGSSMARDKAAYTLRLILEKMGEQRLGVSDERDTIKLLLTASSSSVRNHGVNAATATYKDSWRKNIESIGLITAFTKEEDDSVRQNISYAIGLASPKSILERYIVDGESFCLLTRMLIDRSYAVRRNILWGLTEVFAAQRQQGKYYEAFKEVPELTARNRIDSFDSCTETVESLCRSSLPTKDELRMLHNSCYVIFYSIGDDVIKIVQAAGLQNDYNRVERRLLQLDVIRFIKLTTQPVVGNPVLNTWDLAYKAIERITHLISKSHDKPLVYFFDLKAAIKQILDLETDSFTVDNLKNASDRIDSAVAGYISNTPGEKIKWGGNQDFNFVAGNLLEMVESSNNSNRKITVLDLFEMLYQNKVRLDSRLVILEDALDNENKPRLNRALTKTVHSSKLTREFLTNPQRASLEGRALLFHRRMTESFKDYYGMSGLKDRCIELALDSLQGRTHGLLLSGAAGTGKSSFAKVLANELALPLIILETDKLKEDTPGNIIFQEGATKLSLGRYLDNLQQRIKVTGSCVVLIDNIEKVASPGRVTSVASLSKFLQELRVGKCKALIVATTNDPAAESIFKMQINSDGSSSQIDAVLSRTVSSEVFDNLHPCYFFHDRSVGANFAREYLPTLSRAGKLKGALDLAEASKLSRGLSPASIIFSFSKIPTLDQEIVVSKLKKLKAENDYYIGYLSRYVRTKIDDLLIAETHTLEGDIDCFELALVVEELPLEEIDTIIKNAPTPLNQDNLLKLFNDASKR